MKIENYLTKSLNLELPIIMAPMHFVSNTVMLKAAMDSGIAGAFPSLNHRKEGELEKVLTELNEHKNKNNSKGTYGINLIVGKSNPFYKKHLDICVEQKVPFYITSLGNPKEVIEKAHKYNAIVLSDVTNIAHAKKADQVGCDGFIAVGAGAGGHAGPYPLNVLIPSLKKHFPNKPVIAAGAISSGEGIFSMLSLGASGVSMGTRFIASNESGVAIEYKNGIVNSGMQDIVMTDRLTGTKSTVIYNDFIKKLGLKQSGFEKFMSNNRFTKKYFKMYIQMRGMKWLEGAAIPGSKDSLWMAGQSVEMINNITSIQDIVNKLKEETIIAKEKVDSFFV